MSMPYPQQPAGQPCSSRAACAARAACGAGAAGCAQAGVPAQPVPQGYSTAPQGFVQGYVPVPQGPVKVRVNCVSLVFGICVWVFIALLVLDAWRMTHSPDVSASEADIGGFYPLFVMCFGGPLNLIGAIVASSRAKEKPAKWKLNRLGIILNASPYVIGLGFFFIAYIAGAVAEFFS